MTAILIEIFHLTDIIWFGNSWVDGYGPGFGNDDDQQAEVGCQCSQADGGYCMVPLKTLM